MNPTTETITARPAASVVIRLDAVDGQVVVAAYAAVLGETELASALARVGATALASLGGDHRIGDPA